MKTYHLRLFVISVFFLFASNLFSAETVGSFNFTMMFNGESRTIACFVPNDYNSANDYSLLVGLHGAGDNSVSYRDILIGNAQWQTIMPNTIFVFPDGGSDQAKDFLSPAGDEAIIDSVIKWAENNYNISNTKIYLQGFSLGGRSALKYGLDNPDKVFGLLLHTPAMQSPYDVQNNPDYSSIFKYSNAGKIPISISHGENDFGFLKTVKMLADSLVSHNSKLFYVLIANMAHTITPNQITDPMYKFLFTQIDAAAPVIHKLNGPIISYNKNAELNCRMRNMGDAAITSLTFEYTIDDVKKSFNWTGSITKEKFVDISLPAAEYGEGVHTASISITNCNGEAISANPVFNLGQLFFNVFENGLPLPFKETFADPNKTAEYFAIKESGNYISWMPETAAGKDGAGCMFMLNTLLAYTNFGLTESMYSCKFDFSNAAKPFLKFDVAYNYCYYLPPYFNSKTEFKDTLQIFLSNDEWKTSTSIFKKWGDDLRTFPAPLENPLTIQNFLTIPTVNDWKTIELDLKNYNVNDKTMFRMDYISGSGGVIFFDNFNVYDKDAVSVTDSRESEFSVYPNPAASNGNIVMTLNSGDFGDVQIELYNNLGQKVTSLINSRLTSGENSYGFTLPNLSSGVYLLKAKFNNAEQTANIIIR